MDGQEGRRKRQKRAYKIYAFILDFSWKGGRVKVNLSSYSTYSSSCDCNVLS